MSNNQNSKRIVKVFNLLKPQEDPPTAWDLVYEWLTSRAKLILIVAQVAIVAVFFAKFLVDSEAKYLEEQIISKDQQMQEAYTELEPEIRSFQLKTQNYARLWEGSSRYADVFDEVSNFVSTTDELTLSFSSGVLSITGFGDRGILTDFEIAIRNSQSFYDVELFEVKSEGSDLAIGNSNFGLRAEVDENIQRDF